MVRLAWLVCGAIAGIGIAVFASFASGFVLMMAGFDAEAVETLTGIHLFFGGCLGALAGLWIGVRRSRRGKGSADAG